MIFYDVSSINEKIKESKSFGYVFHVYMVFVIVFRFFSFEFYFFYAFHQHEADDWWLFSQGKFLF
jgi:hypothetical protein